MFFLAASFFSASYKADGILIFNALSFTFSPPLQLLLYVNQHLAQAFSFIFVGFAPPCQKRPSPTVTKKVQKSPKNWEVTVGDTHIQSLRTREKK